MKKFLSIILTVALIITALPMGIFSVAAADGINVWNGTTGGGEIQGAGSAADPFRIDNAEQFAWVISTGGRANTHYALTTDIYLNDVFRVNWSTGEAYGDYEPKSWYAAYDMNGESYNDGKVFKGTLDGAGHTIYGLYYTPGDVNTATGLIPVANGATVKNIRIANSFVSGGRWTGALIGYGTSITIDKVVIDETVTVEAYNAGNAYITQYYIDRVNAGQDAWPFTYAKGVGKFQSCGAGTVMGYANVAVTMTNVAEYATLKVDCLTYTTENPLTNNGEPVAVDHAGHFGSLIGTSWNTTINVANAITANRPYDGLNGSGVSNFENVYSFVNDKNVDGVTVVNATDIIGDVAEDTLSGLDFVMDWVVTEKYPTLKIFNKVFAEVAPTKGTGISTDPFLIENAEQLAYIVQSEYTKGKYYALANDIYINDTSKENWETKARVWFSDIDVAFAGHLEGNGYTINGIYLNETPTPCDGTNDYIYESAAGLFPYAESGAVIRNVHIRNSYISGRGNVGGIVGNTAGNTSENVEIIGCSVDESVTLRGFTVGGLVGTAFPAGVNIYFCYATADVAGNAPGQRANGMIGDAWSNKNNIMNTYTMGKTPTRGGVNGMSGANYTEISGPGFIAVPKANMYGTAAKTAMKDLRWGDVWYTANGKTPQLKVVAEGTFPFEVDEGVKGRVWSGGVATKFAGETGTEEDPYLIETPEQLAYFVTTAIVSSNNSKYYKITADIKLNDTSEAGWEQNAREWYSGTSTFRGHLDGGYHVVTGLYFNQTDGNYTALMSNIGRGASIKRLGVASSTITNNALSMSHTYASAIVAGISNFDGYMGGGWDGVMDNVPLFEECFVAPDVTITADTPGGILGGGAAGCKFLNCYACPTINASYCGAGLYGDLWENNESYVIIENCYVATPGNDVMGTGPKYDEEIAVFVNAYLNGFTTGTSSDDIICLDLGLMQGENAKVYMTGFDYENIWMTVENGTPVLRGFEDAEKYSRMKTDDEDSNITGDCTWSLDGTVLTISGNGKMGDYNYIAPWTAITKVIIEDGVTSIGVRAFSGCIGLTSVTIPDSVKSIGNYAFSGCTNLTSVAIGNGVTSIGVRAFSGCTGLTSVTIPDSVTSIGDYAFYHCTGLTSVTIPDSVTSIGYTAFSGCTGLTSVTIPDSVTSIGYTAFSGCTGLTSVTIGNGVTSIGQGAFYWCTGLENLLVNERNSVYYSEGNCIITKESKALVLGCKTSIIPNGVTSIGDYAFYGCTDLTSVTIPDSVASIGDSAFYGCDNLEKIVCVKGSYAETYATENDIPVEYMAEIREFNIILYTGTPIGEEIPMGVEAYFEVTPSTADASGLYMLFNWKVSSDGIVYDFCREGDVFEEGKYYALAMGLGQLDGIDETTVWKLNGKPFELFEIGYNYDGEILFSDDAVFITYVTKIKEFNAIVDISTPIGEKIPMGVESTFEVTPSTANASGLYMKSNWAVSSDGIVFDFCREGDVFEAGKYYALISGLGSFVGIDDDTAWKLNGKPFEFLEIGWEIDGTIEFQPVALFISEKLETNSNPDDELTLKDLFELVRTYIIGLFSQPVPTNRADFNGDGNVNVCDLVAMKLAMLES